MPVIQNPVLRGFNPDPSFLRVGEDYYLATSTFEWFPAGPIYHSRDLAHWRLLGHALTRPSQLPLQGVCDSAGVWAPSLSFHDGLFYLVYSIVRTRVGVYKDVHNYLVTAPKISGPWSDPIHLNSSGFDPALYHDDDGRSWLVNMQWDFRKDRPRFSGIVLQEYSIGDRRLSGPIRNILKKPQLIEGPNLYKRDGWYYLMLAEGGTGWNHGISMARSRCITGPYELDPQPLVLTSRKNPALALQKAGHGELVQTPAGEWYLAHLCSRPVYPERRCTLGRETAIQQCVWSDDGWLRLAAGGTDPQVQVPAPAGVKPHPWPAEPLRDDFDTLALDQHFSTLRVPVNESWLSLSQRPGWLRLLGRESLQSLFEQSLVARRAQAFNITAETCLEFEPECFTQMAGLICWYDTQTHFYLRVSFDEQLGKNIAIIGCDNGVPIEPSPPQAIGDWHRIFMRAEIADDQLRFAASPDGKNWRYIGPMLDASKLSDDYGTGLHFTGSFVGLCCQDLGGTRKAADFDYFELRQR